MRCKKLLTGFALTIAAIMPEYQAAAAPVDAGVPATLGYQVAAAPRVARPSSLAERSAEASRLLSAQKKQAEYWEYGWGGFNTAALIYTTAAAATENNPRDRNSNIVQAVASLVGIADVVFRPLPAFNADDVCKPVAGKAYDDFQCLAAKERLLAESAERAEQPYTVLPHVANAAFNTVMGVVISQIGTTNQALTSAIPGFIIGELQFFSQPTGPIKDFDQYQLKFAPVVLQSVSNGNPVMGVGATLNF